MKLSWWVTIAKRFCKPNTIKVTSLRETIIKRECLIGQIDKHWTLSLQPIGLKPALVELEAEPPTTREVQEMSSIDSTVGCSLQPSMKGLERCLQDQTKLRLSRCSMTKLRSRGDSMNKLNSWLNKEWLKIQTNHFWKMSMRSLMPLSWRLSMMSSTTLLNKLIDHCFCLIFCSNLSLSIHASLMTQIFKTKMINTRD